MGSFQFEPAEIVKLALITMLAAAASEVDGHVTTRRLVRLLVLVGVPFGLIMLQPDLGTGLVLVAISAAILPVAGVARRHLVVLALIAAVGTAVVLRSNMLEQYQKARLTSFLAQDSVGPSNPALRQARYNVEQSKIAIGDGGIAGAGLFQGSLTRLGSVPEQHTDFIFTAVGEQLGFAGAGTLLALLALIVWRVWRAATTARDPFGRLLCVGVVGMFMFQIFENVGMTMGIMPVTGIPLPFVSYGGSATIAEFAAVGLVLNVHMRRFA